MNKCQHSYIYYFVATHILYLCNNKTKRIHQITNLQIRKNMQCQQQHLCHIKTEPQKYMPILYPLIITYRTDVKGQKVFDDYNGYVTQLCHIDGILRDHAEILVFAHIDDIMQHRILTWSHFCHCLYGCCSCNRQSICNNEHEPGGKSAQPLLASLKTEDESIALSSCCDNDKALTLFRVKYFNPEIKAWCKYLVRQSDMNYWYVQYVKQIMETKVLHKNSQKYT